MSTPATKTLTKHILFQFANLLQKEKQNSSRKYVFHKRRIKLNISFGEQPTVKFYKSSVFNFT